MMNTILINQKNKFDQAIDKIMYRHPYAALFAMAISLPVFILIAIFAGTTVFILPVSWMMGWI